MREYAERRFDKIAKQVSELATLDLEVADENVPGDPVAAEAVLHLKGTQLRAKEVSKDAKHAINLVGGQHGAPGQAPPRQAPRPARVARRGRGARAATRADPRGDARHACSNAPSRARSTASLGSYVHPRARPPNGRSEAVQGLLQARRADQRLGGRARAARGRGAQGAVRRAARARVAGRGHSTRLLPGVVRADPRGGPAHDGDAPLRRAADRRHGPARRPDRRDAHRRGQDPHRHARRRRSTRWPARACTSSRSTTTWPAATRTGCGRSTKASA